MRLTTSEETPAFIEIRPSKTLVRPVYFFSGLMAFISAALLLAAIIGGIGLIGKLSSAERIAFLSLVAIAGLSTFIFTYFFLRYKKLYKAPLLVRLDELGIKDFRTDSFVTWNEVEAVKLIDARKLFKMPQVGLLYNFIVPINVSFLENGVQKRIKFPWAKAALYNPKTLQLMQLYLEHHGNKDALGTPKR